MTTFGFEMEVATNAEALAEALHARSLLPNSTLHGYHCSCLHCDFDSTTFPLRAQTDSSCGGEFISQVFDADRMALARRIMDHLQEAAVEADAEPGYNAGFHVHVGWPRSRRNAESLGDLIWQFVEWEPVLSEIAAGRFRAVRDEMNLRLAPMYAEELFDRYSYTTAVDARRNNFDLNAGWLWYMHNATDRHSNLNVATRFNTFEFRIWNSTRSAWRMELWCRLSIAFMDYELVPVMREATTTADPSVALLCDLLEHNNHPGAADLLRRQLAYMASRPIAGPEPAFTVAV